MSIGIVAIGRNEGERFRRCAVSLRNLSAHKVYVDSGSTDGSLELALEEGFEIVELDTSQPFSAGRARNAGFARLKAIDPGLQYVQFLDGDCSLQPGFVGQAMQTLEGDDQLAIVCGRRREMFPEASVYNRLCDIEWNTPIGDAKACGGDFLVRAEAFDDAGGFNPVVIAGEDDEICVRLRNNGWRIKRIDSEMTLHDADMHRFGQVWQRAVRCGHAYAQGYALHSGGPSTLWQKELRSTLLWSAVLPLVTISLVGFISPACGGLLLIYPVQIARITLKERARGTVKSAFVYGCTTVVGKFAELKGVLTFLVRRARQAPSQIIEYKS